MSTASWTAEPPWRGDGRTSRQGRTVKHGEPFDRVAHFLRERERWEAACDERRSIYAIVDLVEGTDCYKVATHDT